MKGNSRRRFERRRGMAIFMVIMIAFVLASFAAILWHSGSTNRTVREFIIEKKQAEYLAKGAQQHFLLKFRYLPTELYDAVAYSIGKNPYYDFGRPHTGSGTLSAIDDDDASVNPGPMFFFGGGNTTVSLDGDQIPKVDRQKVNLTAPGTFNQYQIRSLLKTYLLDVGTMYPTNNNEGIVVISSDSHEDKAMGDSWRDPYIGNYAVQNAAILGLSGGKRYDKDSLLVTTLGSVRRAKQISLVTAGGESGARNLSMGRTRISDLKFGVHEFPEARSYLEDAQDYKDKIAGDGDDNDSNRKMLGLNGATISSGRRTEIATGIYHIQRQN